MKKSTKKSTLAAVTEQLSDTALVQRAIEGDAQAFEKIMRRHNRLLFRTARSIVKSDHESQDVLQDAYLRAWRALTSFRAESKLSTWLVRIVVNEALGRLRRTSALIIPLDTAMDSAASGTEAWMEDNPNEQPENMAMRAQVRALIEAKIDELPDVFRTVFMLRAVEEMSVDEVAEILNVPPATVRTRFFRARGLLRESLSRNVDVAIDEAFSFAGARCDSIVAHVLAKISEDRHNAES